MTQTYPTNQQSCLSTANSVNDNERHSSTWRVERYWWEPNEDPTTLTITQWHRRQPNNISHNWRHHDDIETTQWCWWEYPIWATTTNASPLVQVTLLATVTTTYQPCSRFWAERLQCVMKNLTLHSFSTDPYTQDGQLYKDHEQPLILKHNTTMCTPLLDDMNPLMIRTYQQTWWTHQRQQEPINANGGQAHYNGVHTLYPDSQPPCLPNLARLHGSVNWYLHCSCEVYWFFF